MLDDHDFQILEELRKDASVQQKLLASKVGLSEPTLSKKIKKLKSDGVIKKYTIDINYAKVGFNFSSLTFVKEKNQTETVRYGIFLSSLSGVSQVFKVAGEWDYVVLWICRNSEELDDSINMILADQNTDNIETILVLRTIAKRGGGASSEAPLRERGTEIVG
jgi:DNA-binding Lrp family transcriptional regulator